MEMTNDPIEEFLLKTEKCDYTNSLQCAEEAIRLRILVRIYREANDLIANPGTQSLFECRDEARKAEQKALAVVIGGMSDKELDGMK